MRRWLSWHAHRDPLIARVPLHQEANHLAGLHRGEGRVDVIDGGDLAPIDFHDLVAGKRFWRDRGRA